MRQAAALCSVMLALPTVAVAAAPASAAPTTSTQPASAVIGLSTPAAGSPSGDRRVAFRPAAAPRSGGVSSSSATTRVLTTGAVAVPTDVAVIGASWIEGTGAGARLSYRAKRAGVWGAWQAVDVESCPGCGVPGSTLRAGSEAIAVTGATHVEGRITTGAQETRDLRLAVIDPAAPAAAGPATTGPRAAARGAGVSGGTLALSSAGVTAKRAGTTAIPAPAGLPGPRISMPSKRASWRAAETRAANAVPTVAPRGVVVHHTAGTNSYTRAQVPSILRGIQRFHVQDRGWGDIGYNALVDRFGRVWEGRRGGIGIPHRGAHARGVNETYLGISYIGDTNARPATTEGVNAMVDLLGWVSARYGFDATGTLTVNGSRKPVIAGHYQVGSTSCPGVDLRARLPRMRAAADARAQEYLAQSAANSGGRP